MKTRPIIFNGEMVRAILEGRKTQTRRIIKFIKSEWKDKVINPAKIENALRYSGNEFRFYDETGCWTYTRKCPYGWFGDFLWVRETWMIGEGGIRYRADQKEYGVPLRWKSPIHLRKRDSRITLKIIEVRAEQVQQIRHVDVRKEGIEKELNDTSWDMKEKFIQLWDSINAKRGYSWSSNPWVWVIEFEREE